MGDNPKCVWTADFRKKSFYSNVLEVRLCIHPKLQLELKSGLKKRTGSGGSIIWTAEASQFTSSFFRCSSSCFFCCSSRRSSSSRCFCRCACFSFSRRSSSSSFSRAIRRCSSISRIRALSSSSCFFCLASIKSCASVLFSCGSSRLKEEPIFFGQEH